MTIRRGNGYSAFAPSLRDFPTSRVTAFSQDRRVHPLLSHLSRAAMRHLGAALRVAGEEGEGALVLAIERH